MPKVNALEVGKGFWITTGVLLALIAFSVAMYFYRRAQQQVGG